ncbi:methyltransferase [Halovivax limisalsi]|uniref:methyltransferase n=1 Tax=Halovivax limisalsi TaxID=1453760 RepID=UPI001FFCF84E|nr:methyltransferase [Halovivax limisalsi]
MSATTPPLQLESRVEGTPDVYRFRTADGVVSPDDFRPSELALAEACWDRVDGHLCCLQANYGVAATLLAPQVEAVTMIETSARAARLCRANARENAVDATVAVTLDPASVLERYEAVVYAPKPYTPNDVGAQLVTAGLDALGPGGEFFLAATKRSGRSRYRAVLESYCDDVERIETIGDVSVLRAVRPPSFEPSCHVDTTVLTPTIRGVDLELVTLPGTFAASALDHGTRLLLETVGPELPANGRILDLCCGYGPIGAYAAAATESDVRFTDDSRLATWCAEQTLERSDVTGTVRTADCLRGVADREFDAVLSNPPTHAGDGVVSSLFAGAADVLTPDGECWFVHHRHLDLSEHARAFDTVDRCTTGSEHVVYRATSRPEW